MSFLGVLVYYHTSFYIKLVTYWFLSENILKNWLQVFALLCDRLDVL